MIALINVYNRKDDRTSLELTCLNNLNQARPNRVYAMTAIEAVRMIAPGPWILSSTDHDTLAHMYSSLWINRLVTLIVPSPRASVYQSPEASQMTSYHLLERECVENAWLVWPTVHIRLAFHPLSSRLTFQVSRTANFFDLFPGPSSSYASSLTVTAVVSTNLT